MTPFIPHFTNECLNNFNQEQINWPIVDKKDLIEENVSLVVQINGKKRAILKVKRDTKENEILEKVVSNQEMGKNFKEKKIKKTIFVSNRLINIII